MKQSSNDETIAPSLGIDGEDASYLIADIDLAFGVTVPNDVGPRLMTVGDYYDWLVSQLDAAPRHRGLDVPARLFLNLRPMLERETGVARIRPSTRLRTLGRERTFESLLRRATSPLKLATPVLPEHWYTSVPFWIAVIAGIVAVIADAFHASFAWPVFWSSLALGVASYAARRLIGPDLSNPKLTVAWLVRRLAADNYWKVAGSSHDSRDIWNALVNLMQAGALPQGKIGRETLLVCDVDFFARPKRPVSG